MSYFTPLNSILNTYLQPDKINLIETAYLLSEEAHSGQRRSTGDPYITHPVAVAIILAEMRMDVETIIVALLHDVIEDTPIDKTILAQRFGEQVAELVDGVSKLTQIKFKSRELAQAENFRKMVLAMAKDLRVIIIKLADRLHNMRTLEAVSNEKRRRIALETLEIYAPLANRLGMHSISIELEDLCFKALYPLRYEVLKTVVERDRGHRKEILSLIKKSLLDLLSKQGIQDFSVLGREKHLYSIYKKMRNKRLLFSDVMDVYAFRIVVNSIDTCYRVLGIAHQLYKPVPERFKDYIAIPKSNGYQSLHTTLFGPYGVPIEIQIRTEEMNDLAEKGIASHWLYKGEALPSSTSHIRAQLWLKNLLELQQDNSNSLEFIENLKIDLFPDEVYVFTPKGKILSLPQGATPVDFAYAIHTDIGNHCFTAKIDRRISPLSALLENGQTVEIITTPYASPSLSWLNFMITSKARSAVRHYFKRQHQEESLILGKRLLERALATLHLTLETVSPIQLTHVLQQFNCHHLDDLLELTGQGHYSPLHLARELAAAVKSEVAIETKERAAATADLAEHPLLICGTEGTVLHFADCCYPIPGDIILGIFEAGKGITIHQDHCRVLEKVRHSDKCIYLNWAETVAGDFPVKLVLELLNQRGVLGEVATKVAQAEANINNLDIEDKDGRYCILSLILMVRDRTQLAGLMRKLRRIPAVSKLSRYKNSS